MVIPIAFAVKGVYSVEFDHEGIVLIVCSLLYTVQTEGIVCCVDLVQHLVAKLNLTVVRTVCPTVAPERVLGFALVRRGVLCLVPVP